MKKYKGKNVRISDEVYDYMVRKISKMYKISKFVEQAIIEKIEKEKLINNK